MILIIRHIDIEGPGSIGEFFNNTSWKVRMVCLDKNETLPKTTEGIEAIIVLGGPMNVYETETYPFLAEEEHLLKDAVKEGIPVLGICLGAQLLAKACGAKVRKSQTKEIGWGEVLLTEEAKIDPFFAHLPKRFSVFQWHEDTFEIPPGGTLLASSGACPNQAFKFGENSYGLQFHTEVNPETVALWIKHYAKDNVPSLKAQEMLLEAYSFRSAYERQGNLILLNFARIISLAKKAMVVS